MRALGIKAATTIVAEAVRVIGIKLRVIRIAALGVHLPRDASQRTHGHIRPILTTYYASLLPGLAMIENLLSGDRGHFVGWLREVYLCGKGKGRSIFIFCFALPTDKLRSRRLLALLTTSTRLAKRGRAILTVLTGRDFHATALAESVKDNLGV